MKIVIDTNVLISGVFFGGAPRMILDAVVDGRIKACASLEIVSEYQEIVEEMINRKQGHINRNLLSPLIQKLELVQPVSNIDVCRDPDDNKFLECAKDSGSIYIVSGDKDLLVIQTFEGIQIVTAKEFSDAYLNPHQNL